MHFKREVLIFEIAAGVGTWENYRSLDVRRGTCARENYRSLDVRRLSNVLHLTCGRTTCAWEDYVSWDVRVGGGWTLRTSDARR